MRLRNKFLLIILIIISIKAFPQNRMPDQITNVSNDSIVKTHIEFLKKYFKEDNSWHITDPEIGKNVNGLINFVGGQPIDTIIKNIETLNFNPAINYVQRLPENVNDSLQVKGFISGAIMQKRFSEIESKILSEYAEKEILIPSTLLPDFEKNLKLVPVGEGMQLFNDSIFSMPDSLKFLDVIPDDMVKTTEDFQHILKMDSIRDEFIEHTRVIYNDSIIKSERNSLLLTYRNNFIKGKIESSKMRLSDSITLNNYYVLKTYNDSIIKSVNDSIAVILSTLSDYANQMDTTRIQISNLSGKGSLITLANNNQVYTRIWLKNEQNDSLSVVIKNTDKKSLMMVIDDGVTFERFTRQKNKLPDLVSPGLTNQLHKIENKYKIETPWNLGGDGNLGFTQTYLENWKKGGKSAISMLMVLKGFANYSNKKIKWENSGEIRNGWIKLGNSDGIKNMIQKNDDKFEITSRFGVSAFKKWYYSTEYNFQTQFFNGYNYPDRENPISGFLAPAKTLFKIGLDYKPNKNLSIFISPLTSKTVLVRDTTKVDQTNFGIDKGRRRFWEPGINADIKFKYSFDKNISYETKYKMFVNYTKPFSKFDIDWENQFKVQFTDHVNMQLMFHMLYDDNVLFTKYDDAGNVLKNPDGTTQKETRLQIKELITVGFTYKINKKIYKSRKVI